MGKGSGDKQALAKLGRVEIDEVAVAFGSPAGCKVITGAAHRPLLWRPARLRARSKAGR
jgi:hypothetical protein